VPHAPAVGANGRDRRSRFALLVALVATCSAWLVVGGSPVFAAPPNDLSLRATYRASAFVHWSNATLTVSSTATVTNTTGGTLRALTFNLVTLQTGKADVSRVTVDGAPAQWQATGQTLVVTLPRKLARGARARVTIDYDARFNAARSGSHHALLIKADGIAAAYRWIPWLSRAQRFGAPNFGETWVTAVSPHVTVTLDSDTHLVFATNGTKRAGTGGSGGGGAQTFTATNVRDFNFSASPGYNVTSVSHAGVKVRFYSQGQLPANVRKWTLAALDRFDGKIGAYPWSHLTVAMTPAGSGMESPGMTWISTSEPPSNLAYLAVHEMAHQWFYGAVGNNQAKQPFLDEGVSDFLARDALDMLRKSRCSEDRLDGSVYDYRGTCYNEVVYVQSSDYIDNYRDTVGGHQFWAGMRTFYRANKFRISNTRAFWDTLDAATGYASKQHADRFPSLYP
jgi:hypothetical protein